MYMREASANQVLDIDMMTVGQWLVTRLLFATDR